MREVVTKIARGEDFLKDPRLAASGALVDVGAALHFDKRPAVQLLQVRLRGRDASDSVLSFTTLNSEAEKAVVEMPLRPELFEPVRDFFERHSRGQQAADSLPGMSPLAKLVEMAHEVSFRVGQRGDYIGSAAHVHAIGDAVGIALLLDDERSAYGLAAQLKHALSLAAENARDQSTLLNALAPAIQAAVVTDQIEILEHVLSHALPPAAGFTDQVRAEANLSRFGAAMRDFLEERGADEVCGFLESFPGPNIRLRLLNAAVDACVSGGSARAINTCGIVVRTLLPSCEEASLYVNDAGIRMRAFNAALSGDWAETEKHLDDMPHWNRSDFLFGWLAGYAMGLQVRSDHELELRVASDQFHGRVCSGNDKFEQTAAQFCRGLVAATQGRNGERSEQMLRRIEHKYVHLATDPEFLSARYAHKLVHASRSGNNANVQARLGELLERARDLGDQGDAMLRAMCQELFSDVTIRNISLRDFIAAGIGRALREPDNWEKFKETRRFAGSLITQSGFSRQVFLGAASPSVAEGAQTAKAARAVDGKARELNRVSAVKSEALDRRLEKLKFAGQHPASEWMEVLRDLPVLTRSLDKAAKIFAQAVTTSNHWNADELALMNEELYRALLRRVRSLR